MAHLPADSEGYTRSLVTEVSRGPGYSWRVEVFESRISGRQFIGARLVDYAPRHGDREMIAESVYREKEEAHAEWLRERGERPNE